MQPEQLTFCRRCKRELTELDMQQIPNEGIIAFCVPCSDYLIKMATKWKDKFAQMRF